tara:strand:- start:62 stop:778 length:717 start_codon:yes stop_codon:yes gene_type:complete
MKLGEMRRCSLCNLDKTFTNFSPKTLKSGIQGWQSECKQCRSEREKKRRLSDIGKRQITQYNTSAAGKARNLRAGRSNAGKATRKRYSQSAKGKHSAQQCRLRRASRGEIRIQNSMHEQLRRMMKSTWYESNLLKVIGCSREHLIMFIEDMMESNMTWENYGYRNVGHQNGWDMDHIIPKSEYDHEEEDDRARCWSLGNLQPMWHVQNLSKSNKIRDECKDVARFLWPKRWDGVLPHG